MNKFSIYCGPCYVETAAKQLNEAGFNVILVGVAHLYVATDLTLDGLWNALRVKGLMFMHNNFYQLPE